MKIHNINVMCVIDQVKLFFYVQKISNPFLSIIKINSLQLINSFKICRDKTNELTTLIIQFYLAKRLSKKRKFFPSTSGSVRRQSCLFFTKGCFIIFKNLEIEDSILFKLNLITTLILK